MTLSDSAYTYPAFTNGEVLLDKKNGRLPAMGWNSWNAFGSGNTEALTKAMADKIIELGLDKLGYEYMVLDDGCYKSSRVDGKLANNEKFQSGFKALSDYMHERGLKFGMYNDIGTNLCAGSAVGTCGYEDVDAQTYLDWGVDFLKVDNWITPHSQTRQTRNIHTRPISARSRSAAAVLTVRSAPYRTVLSQDAAQKKRRTM